MAVKKEFVVNRQGKDFVLYAGLLDLAHEQGLKAITTTLVQVPNELNGHTAIVHATVETTQGIFTGIGDANPKNVTTMIQPHSIRMAETRAKARALRDAVNVGMAALEELGPDVDEPAGKATAERLPQPARAVPTGTPTRATTNGPAWPSQGTTAPSDDGVPHPADSTYAGTASFGPATLARANSQPAAPAGEVDPNAPTPSQIRLVKLLAKQKGVEVHVTGKSKREVSQLIDELQGR